jgi:DNA-binding CsgD family transcriptional regulator
MRPGLIDIIEACYRQEDDTEGWMRSLGEVVDGHMGHGLGLIAIRYRLGQNLNFEPLSMVAVNSPPEAIAAVQRATLNLPPSYISKTFARLPCDIARGSGAEDVVRLTEDIFRSHFEPMGWNDVMPINGLDPTHHGICFGVWLPRSHKMTPQLRSRWSRVAAHLAASNRLRNRLSERESNPPESAEAILTPTGRLEHATADETKLTAARAQLAEGARAIDQARGKLRRTDPDDALAGWRGLVAARWSLVDHFESDGKRYLLARRNDPSPPGLEALSARERQALGFARLGHSNKLIAYEMGVATSTVSVLLHRAGKKLDTHSRAELIAAYTRMLGGDPGE